MRKFFVVALTLGIVAIAGRAAGGQQQDFSKVEIKATKVAGNIYMLEGAGGNIAASIGEDGIVIVDDQFAPLAEKIQAALKNLGITEKPVRFVINTHYHGDHTGGNAPFSKCRGAEVGQGNVGQRVGGRGGGGEGGGGAAGNKEDAERG